MSEDVIFATITKNILEILPDVQSDLITPEQSLADLGANSIDRVDIVTQTLEDLEIEVPLDELQTVYNLQSLADLLRAKTA
jgi:polyketide biosynthesis acyl carrier protein